MKERDRCLDSSTQGEPETGINASDMFHSQVPGLGHQVPGSGVQHQGQVRAWTRTRTWQPVPDARLPRP